MTCCARLLRGAPVQAWERIAAGAACRLALGRPGGKAMTEVRRLLISGVVQGVGFRYSMMAQARLLGVTGWVRNRRDGSVEAMICGSAVQIEEMLAWSRIGPAGSSVDKLIVEPASGDFKDFELRATA